MINDIIQISKEAGELIRNAFGKSHSVEFKTNELNLVTETDKASEKLITDFIRKKHPAHGIIAEEGSEANKSAEYLWVVDPLDGTSNFAHGLPIFAVSIGVQKSGDTIAGKTPERKVLSFVLAGALGIGWMVSGVFSA